MNREISILVPTWGRPGRLMDLVQSVLLTARREPGLTQIWVRVSHEDPSCAEYRWLADRENRVHWYFLEGCTGYAAGIEALRRVATGEIFFCGSDDSLFRTPGWDEIVERAFIAEPFLVAYADNGLHREKCEQFFTTRRWVETVGWLMRPEYEHFCCDQDVESIARGVDCLQFLREVVVEHMHKKYGKAADDATYRRVRQDDPDTNQRDLATFDRLAPDRAAAIARLKAAMYKHLVPQ